jgi:hypothetical protein
MLTIENSQCPILVTGRTGYIKTLVTMSCGHVVLKALPMK